MSAAEVEGENPVGEQRQNLVFEVVFQRASTLARRKQRHARTHLRDGDRGEVKRFDQLCVNPFNHSCFWILTQRLRYNVGIKQDYSKLGGFAAFEGNWRFLRIIQAPIQGKPRKHHPPVVFRCPFPSLSPSKPSSRS